MIAPRSIRSRIVAFFGGLVLILACVAIAGISFFTSSSAERQVTRELAVGERVFARILEDKSLQLRQAAVVLAADFAFREAVATDDAATLRSALENHGRRIKADLLMMTDLNGRITASTVPEFDVKGAFPYGALLTQAQSSGQAAGLAVTGGRLYQVVVLAVRAPAIVGWVAMGFVVEDEVARELADLTGLKVSFLTRSGQHDWRLGGTTLPPTDQAAASRRFAQLLDARTSQSTEPLRDATDMTAVATLTVNTDTAAVAILQRSLASALQGAAQLRNYLMTMTLIGLSAALFGSFVIARGVTNPLRQLGVVAQAMASGDYTQSAEITSRDELGLLATAFNQMREAIATRESTIMDLAYRDGLTQLPNRALLHDRLQQALAHAQRSHGAVSVLLLDLDNFQLINTTLGHQYGDLVLQAVAQRLQGLLARKSDTLARLGGDEFAILLPDADLAAARRTAVRLMEVLEPPLNVGNQVVDVGGSVGIVVYPDHGDDVPVLMSRVDLSMTVAKRTRSGYAEYDPSYEQSPERLSLLGELRSAVENNELVLLYQPKIDLASGCAVQAKALVRWRHPVRGFVPPDDFIPFAEQTGYIRNITQWVIEAACAQLACWRRVGMQLDVCINVSARDLLNNDLPAYIAQCITRHGIAVSGLTLEVTESAIMDDPVRAQDNLQRLHALGLRLSIDDFGTGYSSLAYLKRLPVSELKIDKSFVLNMDKDADDAAIVRSTIDLGHNMGLTVVAEGVERAEAQAMLTAWGCDIAQGYYISRPLAADALETWLKEWQAATPVAPRLSLLSA